MRLSHPDSGQLATISVKTLQQHVHVFDYHSNILCCIDEEEEGQGNDWLYVVIGDIIATHNQTIENVYFSLQKSNLASLLPDEPSVINITEVKVDTAIVTKLPK